MGLEWLSSFRKNEDVSSKENKSNQSQKKTSEQGISRREMLKLAGASIGTAVIGAGLIELLSKEDKRELTKEAILGLIEQQQKLEPGQRAELEQRLDYLSENYSPRIFKVLNESEKMARNARERVPSQPSISGFEAAGLEVEDLQKIWSNKTYPRSWIEGQLSHIQLKTELRSLSRGYNIHGFAAGTTNVDTEDMTFYQVPEDLAQLDQRQRLSTFTWTFSHEIGHANDWAHNNNLNLAQRVVLLSRATAAYNEPGSYRDIFGYIDSINNPDPHIEQYRKVTEFWGELCQEYFTNPLHLKRGNPRDFALIDNFIRQTDKSFDPFHAQQSREIMINKAVNKGSGR